MSRAMAASLLLEGNKFTAWQTAPWLPDLQREVVRFPKGKHDDIVDSVTQFLNWQRARTYEPRVPEVRVTLLAAVRASLEA